MVCFVIGGLVLEEVNVTLLQHNAVELVNVDLDITIAAGSVDHDIDLELLAIVVDVLTELLSNTGQVAEGDLVGVGTA